MIAWFLIGAAIWLGSGYLGGSYADRRMRQMYPRGRNNRDLVLITTIMGPPGAIGAILWALSSYPKYDK